jgi:NAD(P)-dependent dehydrogenase (short-subunit alcohol dehydrogenase family)
MYSLDLKGKVIFVAGGAGDIGSSIVDSFVQQGCRTIIGDMDLNQAEELAAKYPNGLASACFLDVTIENTINEAAAYVEQNFGRLDVLVNVTGVLCRKSFWDTRKEDFDHSLAINVTGMFLVSKAMAGLMKQQKTGAIVNISSLNAKLAIENRIVYGATKAAVNMLTQSMALELAPFHITVNAVAPGVVDSKMARVRLNTAELRQKFASFIPLNRLAKPQDIADSVLFLSSPWARYITGEIILVDGGITARQALPRP